MANKKEIPSFELGDSVSWSTSASRLRSSRKYTGVVVAVSKNGSYPCSPHDLRWADGENYRGKTKFLCHENRRGPIVLIRTQNGSSASRRTLASPHVKSLKHLERP